MFSSRAVKAYSYTSFFQFSHLNFVAVLPLIYSPFCYEGSPVSPGDVFVQLNCHSSSNSNSLGRPIIKTSGGVGPSLKALASKEDVSSFFTFIIIHRHI